LFPSKYSIKGCSRILLCAPNIRVAPAQASNAGDRERCTAVSSKANRGENRILAVEPLESGVSPFERWLGGTVAAEDVIDFRPLTNSSRLNLAGENDFVLVVAWLLGAPRAGGPYIAESG
jgi:hypothetical protein